MAVCGPHAIPHSIFLGRVWPNPHDPLEPYWLPDDRLKQVAWQVENDSRHTGPHACGLTVTQRAEWYGPDGKELRDPPSEVGISYCPACALVQEESKDQELNPGEMPVLRAVQF
jgi:hypothetical protein